MSDHLLGKKLIDAVSLAASFNSDIITVIGMYNVGFTLETTSLTANTGTVIPQMRIKKNQNEYSGWIDITLSSPVVFAGANIATFVSLNQLPPCELRLKYTKGSGTQDGILTSWISGTKI